MQHTASLQLLYTASSNCSEIGCVAKSTFFSRGGWKLVTLIAIPRIRVKSYSRPKKENQRSNKEASSRNSEFLPQVCSLEQ